MTWPRDYKTFFMFNLVEHEILNAHKFKKYQESRLLLGLAKPRTLFFPLKNGKISRSIELSMKKVL